MDADYLAMRASRGCHEAALAAFDALAISHGEPIRGEELLRQMAVTLPPPGSQYPGGPCASCKRTGSTSAWPRGGAPGKTVAQTIRLDACTKAPSLASTGTPSRT